MTIYALGFGGTAPYDLNGMGKLKSLRKWWDLLIENGPKYADQVNPPKVYLIGNITKGSYSPCINRSRTIQIRLHQRIGRKVERSTVRVMLHEHKRILCIHFGFQT